MMKRRRRRGKSFSGLELFIRLADNYYFMYTLLYLLFFLLVFSPFILYHKSLVWGADGLAQDYPSLIYTRNWINEFLGILFTEGKFQGRMWDMTIGEGYNVLNVMAFRPLVLLSLLFMEESLELFFWFRACISMYISGITFSCFCRLFKKLDFACLIGTLIYVFGGVVIGYCFKHLFFIEWTMYLPLMLYGAEKILRRESGKAFMFSVAIAGLSYFYNLYMLTVFAVLYATVRFYFTVRNKSIFRFITEVGRFALYYAAGLGLAAISLVPNLLLSFSSSRTGSENRAGLSLLYDFDYYTSLVTAISDMKSTGNYGFLAFPALVVILVFVLLTGKKGVNRRASQFRLMLVMGAIMMLFPIFALVMNGGGGITNRWFFAASFGAGLIAAFGLEEELLSNDFIEKRVFWILTGCYLLLCFLVGIRNEDKLSYLVFPYLYLAVYFCRKTGRQTFLAKRVFQGFLLSILLLEIGYKAYDFYAPSGENMSGDFLEEGTVQKESENVAAYGMRHIDDEDIYRVDSVELDMSAINKNRNYGHRVGVNGVSSYYSYMPGYLTNTLNELGVSRKISGFDFSSYDQRTILNELSAVKYVTVSDNMRSYVPYGYELIDDEDGISIYRNKYYLPLIYAYSSVIAENDYNNLPANLKEQAMLQGAVIQGDGRDADLRMQFLEFDAKTVLNKQEILNQMKNQSGNYLMTENSITCNELSRFELQFPDAVTGEVYVLLEGFTFESGDMEHGLVNSSVKSKEVWKRGYASAKGYQYYKGKQDILLNLGYVEDDSSGIKINFIGGGTYLFDNIQVIVQPMERYAEQVDHLRISVENLTIDYNRISADIVLEEPRMVCVAVPYDKGWCAKVDGRKMEIQLVSGRYIGLELGEGNYHLELTYAIPGLAVGACISMGTLLLLIIYEGYGCYRKRRRKKDG